MSKELSNGGNSFDWIFLAMSHSQLNQKSDARMWYDKAVAWMEKNNSEDEELRRLRREAEDLLSENDQ